MTALSFATRSFTPLLFSPPVERALTIALSFVAGALWLLLLPMEFVGAVF